MQKTNFNPTLFDPLAFERDVLERAQLERAPEAATSPPSVSEQIQARSSDYWRSIGATPNPPRALTDGQQEAQRQCRALSDALGTDGAIVATQRAMKRAIARCPDVWRKITADERHQLATGLALLDSGIDPMETK